MELTEAVYKLTTTFPKDEIYGLTSQLRRASVSIASNIAEGRGRATDRDFKQFLTISLSSTYEVQTQLMLARRLKIGDEGLRTKAESLHRNFQDAWSLHPVFKELEARG
jgi:four helix bundle protein